MECTDNFHNMALTFSKSVVKGAAFLNRSISLMITHGVKSESARCVINIYKINSNI